LQIAKNVCIDFDEVLPFYKPSSTDGTTEEPEVTDSKTSFALPSKASAEKLVNSFFNTWQPLFPILHRPSFLWDFDAMYTEKGSKDPAQYAQIWLVLAIAARDAITKVQSLIYKINRRVTMFQTITPNSSNEHATFSANFPLNNPFTA
jgi:Fungal specific transcription factor domain